jgi:hypothetical protein
MFLAKAFAILTQRNKVNSQRFYNAFFSSYKKSGKQMDHSKPETILEYGRYTHTKILLDAFMPSEIRAALPKEELIYENEELTWINTGWSKEDEKVFKDSNVNPAQVRSLHQEMEKKQKFSIALIDHLKRDFGGELSHMNYLRYIFTKCQRDHSSLNKAREVRQLRDLTKKSKYKIYELAEDMAGVGNASPEVIHVTSMEQVLEVLHRSFRPTGAINTHYIGPRSFRKRSTSDTFLGQGFEIIESFVENICLSVPSNQTLA